MGSNINPTTPPLLVLAMYEELRFSADQLNHNGNDNNS